MKNDLPKGWEIKKLGEVTSYVDYRGKTPIKSTEGIFLVTAKNVKAGYMDYEISKEYIPYENYEEVMRRGKPQIGDVLITTEAPMGNVASIDREGFALAQRIIKLRGKEEVIQNNFLKFYLSSPKFQAELDEKSTGSTAKGIKGSVLHKMPLSIPPLPEQQKIAQILSTWDEAIQTTQLLLDKLESRKKGMMERLLSGKMLEIGQVATHISIRNKEDKVLPVLSCTKYNGLVDSLEYFGRKIYSDDTSTYKIVPKYTFAYATNHIEEGSIGYQSKYVEALISPMYTVFETNELINDIYLLKSDKYIKIYQQNMAGSIDRRGALRWNDFSKIKIPFPPIEEQTAIAKILDTADAEIQETKAYLKTLKQQKKGLMQSLLTGKIIVKTNG